MLASAVSRMPTLRPAAAHVIRIDPARSYRRRTPDHVIRRATDTHNTETKVDRARRVQYRRLGEPKRK